MNIPNFNSIKVQLERVGDKSIEARHSNFNSIKVQLELSGAKVRKRGFMVFQFHKGTIRTR